MRSHSLCKHLYPTAGKGQKVRAFSKIPNTDMDLFQYETDPFYIFVYDPWKSGRN